MPGCTDRGSPTTTPARDAVSAAAVTFIANNATSTMLTRRGGPQYHKHARDLLSSSRLLCGPPRRPRCRRGETLFERPCVCPAWRPLSKQSTAEGTRGGSASHSSEGLVSTCGRTAHGTFQAMEQTVASSQQRYIHNRSPHPRMTKKSTTSHEAPPHTHTSINRTGISQPVRTCVAKPVQCACKRRWVPLKRGKIKKETCATPRRSRHRSWPTVCRAAWCLLPPTALTRSTRYFAGSPSRPAS